MTMGSSNISEQWTLYVIKSSDGSTLKKISAPSHGTNIQDSIYFSSNNVIYVAMSYQF